jgi:hypothetical protein
MDFYIGIPRCDRRGCSATRVCDFESLSQNSRLYWWHDKNVIISGFISKNSKEGKSITKMIEKNVKESKIYDYIYKLAFVHLSVSNIISYVKTLEEESYRNGFNDKAQQIKNALSLI